MLHWIRTRSRRDLVLACALSLAFVIGVGAFVTNAVDRDHHDYKVRVAHNAEFAFEQNFDVGNQGRLEVHVGEVDVAVSSTDGEARVILHVDGEEASQDVMEAIGFEVEARDGSLIIRTEQDDWNWDGDDYDANLQVSVPASFDVFVQTGDGDVAVGSFHGEVAVQTGDGDAAVGESDGRALRIQTGDGDIALGGAAGGEVRLHTGDGDVAAGYLSADDVMVRTGDGDIHIQELAGRLEATTGDGDVLVHITQFEGLEIRSGDGDITVFTPNDIAADVELSGSDFVIGEALALPVRVDARRVEGQLNGGGAKLSVRVGDGTIRIDNR